MTATEVTPIAAGMVAPDFELASQFGETIKLTERLALGPVVLVFFPAAFTGICTSELCELRDNLDMFKANGVELIGISVDSKATLRAFAEAEGYDFTLLADFWPHGAVAQEYGVFLPERGTANRATFLIGMDGIIKERFMTANNQARSLDAYRLALETIR